MNARFKVRVLESGAHRGWLSAAGVRDESFENQNAIFPRGMSGAYSRVELNLNFEVQRGCENMHLIGQPPVLSVADKKLRARDTTVAEIFQDLKARFSSQDRPRESFALIAEKDERIVLRLERKLLRAGSYRLWIIDINRRRKPSSLALAELFGLTITERKVINDLTEGLVLSEIAELRGISVNTVRAHMKSIFLKTRTNRQVDLVMLVQQISVDFPEQI